MAEQRAGLDRLGRAGRPLPAAERRAVQQAILSCLAATGRPPQSAALAGAAGGADPRGTGRLARRGLPPAG
jgi:hypothetical protein